MREVREGEVHETGEGKSIQYVDRERRRPF